jgi:hypothetical protein
VSASFSGTIAQWAADAKASADEALRAASLELLRRAVVRSPVGNPELWAANAHAAYARQTYNLFAERVGAKQLKPRTLERKFRFRAGRGYTGGRFRGNWQVSFGSPAASAVDTVDPGGGQTLAAGLAALAKAKVGVVIYIVNNVPYAERLEFGWSKQAPSGVVRVTAAEFQGIVTDLASSLKK